MSGETIDGGAPYEFDDAGHDPAFIEALEETRTEYREALDRLSDDPSALTPEEADSMVDRLITEVQGVEPKGSPKKLNKRSILMNLHDPQRSDEHAYFVHLDEDGEKHTDGYHMPLEVWDDLGQPDTITVVVYPKDMLN